MQGSSRNHLLTAMAAIVLFASGGAFGQAPAKAPVKPQFKFSTPIAPGVAVPDKIESSIGTLNRATAIPSRILSRRSMTTSIVRAPCRLTSWRFRS